MHIGRLLLLLCIEPIKLSPGVFGTPLQNSLQQRSQLFLEIPLPASNEMTITLNATSGQITAYFSTEVTNPNEAFYQWSAETSEEQQIAQVFINVTDEGTPRRKRQAEIQRVYGTIINTFNISSIQTPNANITADVPVPETVFTLIAEEGDTRIDIFITEVYYTTSELTTQDIVTTEAYYTTLELTTPEITDQLITLAENTRAPINSQLSAGIVTVIVICILILLILVIIVAACLMKRRNSTKKPDAEATNMDEVSKNPDIDGKQDNAAYNANE